MNFMVYKFYINENKYMKCYGYLVNNVENKIDNRNRWSNADVNRWGTYSNIMLKVDNKMVSQEERMGVFTS